jgi:hypothetical protein
MEDWLYAARTRQFQLVSDTANLLKNSVGTKELKSQFVGRQGRLNISLQLQKNFVTHYELTFSAMFIGLAFHAVLHPK